VLVYYLCHSPNLVPDVFVINVCGLSGCRAGRGCTSHSCFSACRGVRSCKPCSCFSACRGGTGCTPRSRVSPCGGVTSCTPRICLSASREGMGCTPCSRISTSRGGTVSRPWRTTSDSSAQNPACGSHVIDIRAAGCEAFRGSLQM
jgi:hypothetical protein